MEETNGEGGHAAIFAFILSMSAIRKWREGPPVPTSG